MLTYRWQSLLDPDQHDEAKVEILENGVRAEGVQLAHAYSAQWRLDAADGWVTRALRVDVTGRDGWSRSLRLDHDGDGVWRAETGSSGSGTDLPPPGLGSAVDLTAARDIDLGRCPMTNLMPIRRLGLLTATVPATPLIMAWVEMPSLRVISSDQYYSSASPGQVRYVSGTRHVDVRLTLDEHGMVTHYPDLATLLRSDQRS